MTWLKGHWSSSQMGSDVRVFTPVPLLREQGSPPPSFLPVQRAWTRLSFGSVSRIQFVSYIIIRHRNYISNATQTSITRLKSKPYLQCYYQCGRISTPIGPLGIIDTSKKGSQQLTRSVGSSGGRGMMQKRRGAEAMRFEQSLIFSVYNFKRWGQIETGLKQSLLCF